MEHELRKVTVGLDEVGRGALAGPVVVGAACLLTYDETGFRAGLVAGCGLKTLKDSKKHSAKQREAIAAWITASDEVAYGIGAAEAAEVDHFGIIAATTLAAERALAALKRQGYLPVEVLADAGLHHPFEEEVPTRHFVKGDETVLPITVASHVAKVWRDALMADLAVTLPGYGLDANVGYGTSVHLEGIRALGLSAAHRKSFLSRFVEGS